MKIYEILFSVLFIAIIILMLVYVIATICEECKSLKKMKVKKKAKEAPDVTSMLNKPHIIKYPQFKTLKCRICHCEYSGGPENLHGDIFGNRNDIGIDCPLCGCFNPVEFVDDEPQ